MARLRSPHNDLKDIKESGLDLRLNIIYLEGTVGDEINFIDFDQKMSLAESNKKPITIKLMSDGGDIFVAAAICGRIINSPCTVIIEAHGSISSAAVLMLAVGDIRKASKFCAFMHHDVSTVIGGKLNVMVNTLNAIHREEQRRYNWLAEYTKMDAKWWQQKASPEYYFDAQEALKIGLIDELF